MMNIDENSGFDGDPSLNRNHFKLRIQIIFNDLRWKIAVNRLSELLY